MPYQIKKVGNKYKLYNLHKKQYVKVSFNTRESAIRQDIEKKNQF